MIWHFCHVMSGARLGTNCSVGQNCFVAGGAVLGDRVRLQNNVSVFDGVELGDDVFCGPSVVFTNVRRPRAGHSGFRERTHVMRGATLGANATIRCGVTLGEYCFVGAGCVVTADVAPYAEVAGVPGKQVGWVSRCAERLVFDSSGSARCPLNGDGYQLAAGTVFWLEAGSVRSD
ncbi:MAG: hypothetical protein RJA70_278 [Pseudomonadota bacterium]